MSSRPTARDRSRPYLYFLGNEIQVNRKRGVWVVVSPRSEGTLSYDAISNENFICNAISNENFIRNEIRRSRLGTYPAMWWTELLQYLFFGSQFTTATGEYRSHTVQMSKIKCKKTICKRRVQSVLSFHHLKQLFKTH